MTGHWKTAPKPAMLGLPVNRDATLALLEELKRRNVFRVALAYLVVAWLLIEVASTLFPILQLPEWSVTLVTLLLIMGFPVALVLAWAFELTPRGLEADEGDPQTATDTRHKMNLLIIAALSLILVLVFVDQYVLDDSAVTSVLHPGAKQADSSAEPPESNDPDESR